MFPLLFSYLACTTATKVDSAQDVQVDSSAPEIELGPEPSSQQPSPSLRRLTISQYQNIIKALFSEDVVIPSSLEPDIEVDGFLTLGASISNISPVGIERYEAASYSIAEQIVENDALLAELLPCETLDSLDQDCWESFLNQTGSLLWRRSLTDSELEGLSALTHSIIDQSDQQTGFSYLLAALLQSPNFLYRIEQGENQVLNDFELASRLSFLIWNSAPDQQLFEIAEEGNLTDPEQLEAEVDRMLSDLRFEDGLRNFFSELLHLYDLDTLVKDPLVFTHASPDLYQSAKEETLLFLLDNVLGAKDYRDILTSQDTFIDRRLAALYNIPAYGADGFAQVTLEESMGRRGLLTQASVLNIHAHATSTSATGRGIFVLKSMLCYTIPAPPSNVNTSIPEADAESPTLRERLKTHLEDPSCASCHEATDRIGLGLENFDGIGRWRTYENGAQIDPSGEVDGISFLDAWDLGRAVKEHEDFGPCISENLYQYALGHQMTNAEEDVVNWLSVSLTASDWSFQELLRELVLSESFKRSGVIQ